jgi:transposase
MKRFIEGEERSQVNLLPECLDDFIVEDNPVRVIDAFADELDLIVLGFDGAEPAGTGRPSYHPAVLLKIYIYGYLIWAPPKSKRLVRKVKQEAGLRSYIRPFVRVMRPAGPDGIRRQGSHLNREHLAL